MSEQTGAVVNAATDPAGAAAALGIGQSVQQQQYAPAPQQQQYVQQQPVYAPQPVQQQGPVQQVQPQFVPQAQTPQQQFVQQQGQPQQFVPQPVQQTAPQGQPQQQAQNDFGTLPPWAQAEIVALRREAAAGRTGTPAQYPVQQQGQQLQQLDPNAARAQIESGIRMEYGEKLAAQTVAAALTGLVPNPGAIAQTLNMRSFVRADGSVDNDAVTMLRGQYQQIAAAYAPQPQPIPGAASGGAGGGAAGTSKSEQFAAAMGGLLGDAPQQ